MRVEVRRRAEAIVLPVLGVAVVLVAFEVAPRVGILPRATFPPLSESARALWDLITTGDLWPPVLDTLDWWVRAMVIATLIGVPLGLTIGASRLGSLLTGLTSDFLRPIPSVALIPAPLATPPLPTASSGHPSAFRPEIQSPRWRSNGSR